MNKVTSTLLSILVALIFYNCNDCVGYSLTYPKRITQCDNFQSLRAKFGRHVERPDDPEYPGNEYIGFRDTLFDGKIKARFFITRHNNSIVRVNIQFYCKDENVKLLQEYFAKEFKGTFKPVKDYQVISHEDNNIFESFQLFTKNDYPESRGYYLFITKEFKATHPD